MLLSSSGLDAVITALPYMLQGVWLTLGLVVGAMGLGLLLGIPMAVTQSFGSQLASRCVSVYVWLFRGAPILVQMYLFYFGVMASLGEAFPLLRTLGLDSGFASAVIVLGLTSAAYQSQIFRGAIQSVPAGQLKAARALGMSDATAIRSIILPQALRLSIPGWSNEYSIILKDSALAFTIGVVELMSRTRSVAAITHEPLPLSLLAGGLFYALTWLGVRALNGLERRTRVPGLSGQGRM